MFSKRKAGGGTVDLVKTAKSSNSLTHNKDGKYSLFYGVDTQGNYWRTNTKSLYRPLRTNEKLPEGMAEKLSE